MTKKSLLFTACPLYLFFYMGDAFLSSYYSLYFIARGIPEEQSAILLALIPFSLFLGCVILSALARTRKIALWLFRACAIIEAGLVIGYAFCATFPSLLVLTILIGFFNGAPFALIEGYMVPLAKAKKANYSTIRLFGSLGYIVSLAVGYLLLSNFPLQNCFFFSGGLFLTALGISFLLRDKEEDFPEKSEEEREEPKPSPTPTKFLTPGIIFFIVSMSILYGAYNASSYLLPVRLNELGYLDQDYSLARSIAVIIELITLLLMPLFLKRVKNKKLPIYIAVSFLIIATGCAGFVTNPWALAYLNLGLGHIGKGFLFASEAIFVASIVGKERLSKALTIYTGGLNLVTASLNLSSSSLHQAWSFQGYFGLLAGLEVLGLILLIPCKAQQPLSEDA